jgi:hypothetical protein
VGALILACGGAVTSDVVPEVNDIPETEYHEIPATPGKSDVDSVLKTVRDGHLVVAGTDADLAAVVLRMLRTDRLGVPVGYLPVDPASPVAALWGLPGGAAERLATALAGTVRDLPLVRDDAGGVLLGRGVLAPVSGVVYCDDATALRGRAERIEVAPDPAAGLVVRVTERAVLRRRTRVLTGRAVQFGVDPVAPVRDGVGYPRPMTRWTWYRHTANLRAVR